MLVVNLKAYEKASGDKAIEIAKICQRVKNETGKRIVVSPQHTDLHQVSNYIKSFSQHVDPVKPGSHTGSVTPDAVKDAGGAGSLINHSERRVSEDNIEKAVKLLDERGLTSVVCAQTPDECDHFSRFDPDYIAYEPPELIGSSTSVSEAKPDMIKEAVEKSNVPVLVGAGIKDIEDVEKAMEYGCEGVMVASGVVKAEEQYREVKELASGLS